MNIQNHGIGRGTGNLSTQSNVIKTDRYDIHVRRGNVRIFDRQTRTWVEAWGDPHLKTSDGDKAQFHRQNLTIDLQDGTKVTIVPTPPGRNGLSWVGALQVLNGDKYVEVKNIHRNPCFGSVHSGAKQADARIVDGTVLQAGHQVDDLFFASGREMVGGDPRQRFGEHMLDGRGGVSRTLLGPGGALGAYEPIMDSIEGLFAQIRGKLGSLKGMKSEDSMRVLAEIQMLQSQLQQTMTALSNLMRAEHETKMSVARNMRA